MNTRLRDIRMLAFKSGELLKQCRDRFLDYWDDEEIYFVFDEIKESLAGRNIDFMAVSFCAGIIRIQKP